MLLHRALETFALGDADDIDVLAGLEAGDRDGIAHLDLVAVGGELADEALRDRSGFFEVAEFGFGDAMFLLVEDADLGGGVAVVVEGLDLEDRVGFGEDDGDGRDGPGLVVDAGHAHLLS